MTFIDFINKYYKLPQREEIKSTLHYLDIYGPIESSINDFYDSTKTGNQIKIISQLTLTCREFLTVIYIPLQKIKPVEQKVRTEQKISELVSYLIDDTYQYSGLDHFEYFDVLKLTVNRTYLKYSWDLSDLEKKLDRVKTNTFTIKKNKEHIAKLSTPFKLGWLGKQHLDLFIDDLISAFPGVRTKKNIYLLFEDKKIDFKIELPLKHLLPFLTLFHKLHESGTLNVKGNRGLFVYLHKHLQAPPEDRYPKREFRKLRHEAERNVIVRNNIYRKIKPLLDKYGGAVN